MVALEESPATGSQLGQAGRAHRASSGATSLLQLGQPRAQDWAQVGLEHPRQGHPSLPGQCDPQGAKFLLLVFSWGSLDQPLPLPLVPLLGPREQSLLRALPAHRDTGMSSLPSSFFTFNLKSLKSGADSHHPPGAPGWLSCCRGWAGAPAEPLGDAPSASTKSCPGCRMALGAATTDPSFQPAACGIFIPFQLEPAAALPTKKPPTTALYFLFLWKCTHNTFKHLTGGYLKKDRWTST